MAKILIVPVIDWLTGPEHRLHNLAKVWAKSHEVHVFRKIMNEECVRSEKDITLHEPFTIKTNNWVLFYLLNFIPQIVVIFKIIKKNDIDVVIAADLFTGTSAIIAAKLAGTRVIFDYLDDFPTMVSEYLSYYIKNPPNILKLLSKKVSGFFLVINLKYSDATVTIGEMLELHAKRYSSNVYTISNGVDIALFEKYNSNNKPKHIEINKFTVLYIGSIEFWVDLQCVIDAIEKIPDVDFCIVGHGKDLEKTIKYVKEHSIKNTSIVGRIPFQDVPKYIHDADVCVIPFKNNPVTDFCVPLKVHEYAACKKPIISTPLYEIKRIYGNSMLYASNKDEYVSNINKLKNDARLCQMLAEKAYVKVQRFDWNILGTNYEHVLRGEPIE